MYNWTLYPDCLTPNQDLQTISSGQSLRYYQPCMKPKFHLVAFNAALLRLE